MESTALPAGCIENASTGTKRSGRIHVKYGLPTTKQIVFKISGVSRLASGFPELRVKSGATPENLEWLTALQIG